MSFENLKAGEDTRFNEMRKGDKTNDKSKDIPVDGEDVGNPDAQSDKLVQKDSKKEEIKTLAEITEDATRRQLELSGMVEKNKDWPAASGNKKSEERLAGELDNSLNEVV